MNQYDAAFKDYWGFKIILGKQKTFSQILLWFERGEEVKLTSFGTFKIRNKKERVGRNPKTGIEAKISSRKVVTFKPSRHVKEKIINW